LYGCEILTLTLREENKLRVFENRVQTRIFVSKRDVVTGDWRELHNEKLYNLYSTKYYSQDDQIARMRWAGHVACTRKMRNDETTRKTLA
jgi:hypothetical protein